MANMHRIIHTKSNCKDNVYTWDDVNSDVPEVKKSDDIGQSDDDNSENHEANGDICEEYQCDDKNTDHGQPNISPQLKSNNFIGLPGSINLYMTKCSG